MPFEEEYKVLDKAMSDIDAELKRPVKKRVAFFSRIIPVSKKQAMIINHNLLKVTFGLLAVSKQVLGILEQLGAEDEEEEDNGMYE